MSSRGMRIAVFVLIAIVLVVVLFGGRLEDWLLRLHGIHREVHS